jgi:C1A family cysteine protease
LFKKLTGFLVLILLFSFCSIFVFTSALADEVDERVAEMQKRIDQKGLSWTAGRSWTTETSIEQARKLCGHNPPDGYYEWLEEQPKLTAAKGMTFPSVFDWRDSNVVTPVKSQGGCGSCWAFAATGAFEANVMIHERYPEMINLSEQQVLSCNIYEAGCGGGWAAPVYELFRRYGAVSEECMPYEADDGVPCTQDECEVLAKLKDWVYVENDVNAIKTALLNGPAYISFNVYTDFYWYYYDGCYEYDGESAFVGGHAVVLVGWADTACGGEGAWICKNSWGEDWAGLDGYFYIKWGTASVGRSVVLPLYPPDPVELVLEDRSAWEISGIADGHFKPGETISVSVDLKNLQADTATGVQATLSTSFPGINITQPTATFPDIATDQIVTSDSPHFSFEIDPSAEVGERVDFDLAISCDQGSFNESFYLFIGQFVPAFFDDMEGDDNGWTHFYYMDGILEDDWEHGEPQEGSRTDPTYAYSGTKVWGNDLDGNYSDSVHNYLRTPIIDCQKFHKTRIWFYRWLAVENSEWDTAAIYVNDSLVWVNDSVYDHIDFKWHHHDVDISAYADSNPTVQVRFELKSDQGLHLGGWSIDDFAIVGILDYVPGDANKDSLVDVVDVVYLINYVLKSGPAPTPLEAGDANCDGLVDVVDITYLINYLFKNGPEPCAP